MELVYLWVEEYKNIKNQGFNFSPKFNCHYDGETLTIKDNVDEKGNKLYIENFFGDDINVTAIVGKNGSGKSSVLEILKILYSKQNIGFQATLLLKDKDGEWSYLGKQIETIKVNSETEDLEVKQYKSNFNILTHGSDILNWFLSFNQNNTVYDLGEDMSFSTFKDSVPLDDLYWDTFKLDIMKYRTMSQSLVLKYFASNKNIEFFKPDKYAMHRKNTYLIRKIMAIVSYFSKDSITTIKRNVEELLLSYNDYEAIIKIYLFLVQLSSNHCDEANYIYNAYKKKKLPDNEELDSLLKSKDDILSISRYIVENIKCDKSYLLRKKQEALLKILEYKYSKDIFSDLLQIHLFEEKTNKAYKDLSSGEMHSIFLVSFLDFYLSLRNYNLILLDEIETFNHPSWSKNIIKRIHELLDDNNCHLIVSTHSPFLLSDIPKQNIIFLNTYKEKDVDVKEEIQEVGNCRVILHDEVFDKKQTFGQNIHTLLSDIFFMGDGLMGEFARGKINEIIDFHKEVEENKKDKTKLAILKIKYKEVKNKFWDIQSIIGEDYLQQVIKNHLRDTESLLGYKEAREEEIKRLRAEADRLENLS